MALVDFAKDAEDVASALHTFRDNLPRATTKITSTITELFALSTVLRELDDAQSHPRHSPSFYRVQDDLDRAVPSLQRTLGDVLDMFARSREMPYQMVWDDLGHRMEWEERVPLIDRLRWYHDFLRAQLDILNGYQPADLRELRHELRSLWNYQQTSDMRLQRRPSHISSPSTPRPGPSRPPLQRAETSGSSRPPLQRVETPGSSQPPFQRMETPVSAVTASDDWDGFHQRPGMPPPVAPEAPNVMPQSPTFTSSSSNTLNSSQTSYSSNDFMPMTPALVHWAQDVFDGMNPGTKFRNSYQLLEPSVCYGTADTSALQHLISDGFIQALHIPFDREQLLLRLYFRPSDNRARILIISKASSTPELHHCSPLTNLRTIRQGSTLLLCRIRKGGTYIPWARLNFYLYERMVLFYNTFVAMKRQDRREVPHEDLLDDFQLMKPEGSGEEMQFGGVVKDGPYRHALRMFKDHGSGVVRLEASAFRGPMKDVPLWTAFVTKYANDPDWVGLDGESTVSLAALKPPPYVFLSGYHPPKRGHEYTLNFDERRDAQHFIEVWTGLCRSN